MTQAGDEIELDVLRIAHGGVQVADADGRVVFLPDAIPGERVLACITDTAHDRFWRADTVRVLTPSPDRQAHVWAAASVDRAPADRAGGAEFGHIGIGRQRALKAQVLCDALRRTGRLSEAEVSALEVEVEAVPGTADGTRSRTRVRLHADPGGRVGPYAGRSRHVVPVVDLPLATERLEALLPAAAGGAVDLVDTGEEAFALPQGAKRPAIEQRVGARTFTLEAAGFWQVHPAAADVLTTAVQQALDPAAFDQAAANLDLYGGVGLLAAALADIGGPGTRITTVEADRRASVHARRNVDGVRAVTARVDAFLRAEQGRRPGATVVLDPPRAGAGAAVVDALAAVAPARIVYVACDPVALARDLARFAARGWRPVAMRAFDLFPNTHHFEVVAALAPA